MKRCIVNKYPMTKTINQFITTRISKSMKGRGLTEAFPSIYVPSMINRIIFGQWVGRQTQWWPRHKAIYFSWFGPELFCLLLGPPGFNCWFSSDPVFQWCCSTPQGSPGVGRNTFLSSPHLCFIIVFICDLFVHVMIHWWVIKPPRGPNNCMFWAMIEAEGEVRRL